jgi:coenzyme PQQ precursor peptide PqqA
MGYSAKTFRGSSRRSDLLGVIIMEWTAPAFEEVCLNCEINSYASAKL